MAQVNDAKTLLLNDRFQKTGVSNYIREGPPGSPRICPAPSGRVEFDLCHGEKVPRNPIFRKKMFMKCSRAARGACRGPQKRSEVERFGRRRTAEASRWGLLLNHQSLSAFIWSVADLLRGDYKQSDY